MTVGETELLYSHLAGGQFIITQDNSKRDAGLFGRFELSGKTGFNFIREFGLERKKVNSLSQAWNMHCISP